MSGHAPVRLLTTDWSRMDTFPFELLIQRASSDEPAEPLLCKGHLRVIPGLREVYDAVWRGRNVVAKVFSCRIGAGRRFQREWRGLCRLRERGVNAPEPLFYGRTQDGRWTIVVEKIADSTTALTALRNGRDRSEKLDLLIRVARELAAQHETGVFQKDFHLGNFLCRKERLFSLDPAQMRFLPGPVGRRRSVSQLALLARSLPETDNESVTKLYEEYFKARRWRFTESDEKLLRKESLAHRRNGIRNCLKKCMRTSRRYLRVRTSKHLAVFERAFYAGAEPLDFVEQIDELMAGGEILKNGNSTYVSRLTWNGRDIVVKRYNHKGLVHSLRHTIKKSRARQGWLHAHRLMMLNIPTPRAMAYIERRRRLLVWNCYLVTEYVEGPHFDDILRDEKVTQENRSAAAQGVVELLDKLAGYRITHGDLKHTNILIRKNGPVLTDLDGMRVHMWDWTCRRRQGKDLKSFRSRGQGSYGRL